MQVCGGKPQFPLTDRVFDERITHFLACGGLAGGLCPLPGAGFLGLASQKTSL